MGGGGGGAIAPVASPSFGALQRSAFSDVRVCHPNAESYRDLKPQQKYRVHESEKKRQYSGRVLDIELGTFTPLALHLLQPMEWAKNACSTSLLAELIALKKGELYS